MQSATAFAPASVANVAVGYDVLGFAIEGPGDEVRVERIEGAPGQVVIEPIDGFDLPLRAEENTAGMALLALIEEQQPRFGFRVWIEKGIRIGSGLGGSSASAVGAVVAANALLEEPLAHEQLLPHALAGEAVASGARHGDNVAPCLLGGLQLFLPDEERALKIPVPKGLICVAASPHYRIDTSTARGVLPAEVSMGAFVRQSSDLAAFVHACHTGDIDLLRICMRDRIVGPARADSLIGLADVAAAVIDQGAVHCGISGSGPGIFTWCEADADTAAMAATIKEVLGAHGVTCDLWTSPVEAPGARVIATS